MAPVQEKLLVVSEIGLGDALTLLPCLRGLKRARPDVAIEMLAPGLFALRENVRDTVTVIDHAQIAALTDGRKRDWLLARDYGAVWNTENEASAWRRIFSAEKNPRWVSAPPHRTWKRESVLDLRLAQLRTLYPEAAANGPIGLDLTPVQLAERDRARTAFGGANRLVAIQPGAKDKTKVWPAEKFVALASLLAARPDCAVVFLLGPEERPVFETLIPDHPSVFRVSRPLDALLPVLAACDLFIGNDSGFYHLAHMLGLRTVGIFRSRRNLKVWSYPTPRSRAVCFYLPSLIRKHWKKCLSTRRVWKEAASLLTPN
jgi:ADP-heptose:LPS heptosyltransferase